MEEDLLQQTWHRSLLRREKEKAAAEKMFLSLATVQTSS